MLQFMAAGHQIKPEKCRNNSVTWCDLEALFFFDFSIIPCDRINVFVTPQIMADFDMVLKFWGPVEADYAAHGSLVLTRLVVSG